MFSYSFANKIASWLISEIADGCEKVQLVGSLRRGRRSVNDIDIVAIPKIIDGKDDSLFGNPVKENLLDKKLSHLCLEASLILESNGPKIKKFSKLVRGVPVPIDLYIASEATWWTLLLIRTGSREHNIFLAKRAIDLHMQLKADGSGLLTPGGTLLQITSEQEIYQHLRLAYRSPDERS